MAQDHTAREVRSVKHPHDHGHPPVAPGEPVQVPHLDAALDDHGPGIEHGHVHRRGGPERPYDHHDHLDGDDHLAEYGDDLK